MTADGLARTRLDQGLHRLGKRSPQVKQRDKYVRGAQELPFAPQGATQEYMDLRKQAIANWIELYVTAPVQRLEVTGVRAGIGGTDDEKNATNSEVWGWFTVNKWKKQQGRVFRSMMMHGQGIVSVWPNTRIKSRPIIRHESFGNVYLHPSIEDPMVADWAVKVSEEEAADANELILPAGFSRTRKLAWVYSADTVHKYASGGGTSSGWEQIASYPNVMKRVPFATYDHNAFDDGQPWSGLDHMMVQQDALNTVRFNMLLAMQFSAYRQRIISGFDPRVIDEHGRVVYRTNEDGTPMLDDNGNPIPALIDIGKVGVDRFLTFPGDATKVFDLPESNLKNYTDVYDSFLNTFFATGQIPTQYMPQKMSNLTGDALAGAESAFASLIRELQRSADEGVTETAELAWIAAGHDPDDWNPAAEASWADAEARSFSQIVDAITKLVSVEFPHRSAFEMIPGATDQKVNTWMEQRDEESFERALAQIERPFQDATVR